MKLHFVGLPHTTVSREYEFCAYTQKLLHMLQICEMIGYDTFLYESDPSDRERWFGDTYLTENPPVFKDWDPSAACWREMNARTIMELHSNIEPSDAICIIAGRCQEEIKRAFPDHLCLEWAVGYEGVLDDTHKCFESNIWRHFVYGRNNINDGRFFDCVIPNSFDVADFAFYEEKSDYLLYLGRLTPRKGLAIVEEIAKKHRVVTAGQGDERVPGAEHLGVVKGTDKAMLLAQARGLICPTQYIEPFGGVAVEAMLSGTPVISTDFGAFTETVDTMNGFKCRTLKDFLYAADNLDGFDSKAIAARARFHYSLEGVAPKWERWFDQVDTLHQNGWYS